MVELYRNESSGQETMREWNVERVHGGWRCSAPVDPLRSESEVPKLCPSTVVEHAMPYAL